MGAPLYSYCAVTPEPALSVSMQVASPNLRESSIAMPGAVAATWIQTQMVGLTGHNAQCI